MQVYMCHCTPAGKIVDYAIKKFLVFHWVVKVNKKKLKTYIQVSVHVRVSLWLVVLRNKNNLFAIQMKVIVCHGNIT